MQPENQWTALQPQKHLKDLDLAEREYSLEGNSQPLQPRIRLTKVIAAKDIKTAKKPPKV